jgi:uncharacterized protein (TIGR02145 family)
MKTKHALTAILWIAITFTLSCDKAETAAKAKYAGVNNVNNPSALVGKWVGISGSHKDIVMELLGDGTGIFSGGPPITWKTDNGRFYITVSGQGADVVGYKLQDSLLTFTDNNGEVSEYTKCHKDCKVTAEAARAKVETAAKAKYAGVKKEGSFTDARDSKTYKTVKLDKQTWMAENLNFNADSSKCYEDSESNCQKYGRLYYWETAMNACPKGWHLPSYDEWRILVNFAGGKEAGKNLKASNGWDDDYDGTSGNGLDVLGFSAVPASRGFHDGTFNPVGIYGFWWSASEKDDDEAHFVQIKYNYDDVMTGYTFKEGNLHSVRCVQD